ncbi:enoyl-CoA hydratase/carnithine racemase [Rhodoligotrophos appendicifer]|uniref:enoyl-CoA hydratase/isomerase family protein n=1 Tax=Rhodoligotrophos appendicifer TaxID=987056 RepID=UPI0011872C46|nr:enoyl-CoA hydratase/isomerase family protein [Rhodoligotrophos appendicifer]
MPIVTNLIEPGIVCVSLDNPGRRNALDHAMFLQLAELWPALAADPSVRVVLMRGHGEDAFCSGADLSANLDRLADIDELLDRALLKTTLFSKPLVASIVGACVAGGLELALAADLRIAAEDARFGMPEVRWGIMPSGGGAMKLALQIGQAKAMDLLLTGRMISGRDADGMGLVSEICSRTEVWTTALERARMISRNSWAAVQATKEAALGPRTQAYLPQEAGERALAAKVRASGHPEEGKAAFLQKRAPVFL